MCVGKSQSGEDFCQMIIDQFDQLYTELHAIDTLTLSDA
jgi:hypothetical protein